MSDQNQINTYPNNQGQDGTITFRRSTPPKRKRQVLRLIHNVDTTSSDEDKPPKKRQKRDTIAQGWFTTWNSYPTDWKTQLGNLQDLERYACQPEQAGTGQPHIQGILWFSKKKKHSWMRAQIPGAHWEKARDIAACVKYCQKMNTKDGEVWVKGFAIKRPVKDPLAGKKLYKYQKFIEDMCIKDPHDREIWWFWSDRGCIGKSALCKHLVLKFNALVLGGKLRDALYVIVQWETPPRICIFDLPRSAGDNLDYQILEKVKDGCFLSTKYKGQMYTMNPPHVIVFANHKPVERLLSKDRWKIRCLDNEADIPRDTTDQF